MNIDSGSYNVAKSILEMGNLLKTMTSESMDMQTKLMKVSVTESVSDPNLGQKLDMMA